MRKDVGDGSIVALSKAVVAYLQHGGLSGAHLVGHSLGGAIAVQVALDNPDLVSELTLVAPAGFGPDIAGDFIDGFITQSRPRKLRGVLEGPERGQRRLAKASYQVTAVGEVPEITLRRFLDGIEPIPGAP